MDRDVVIGGGVWVEFFVIGGSSGGGLVVGVDDGNFVWEMMLR